MGGAALLPCDAVESTDRRGVCAGGLINGRDPSGTCADDEQLWAQFYDNDGDGALSEGDTILGVYCKKVGEPITFKPNGPLCQLSTPAGSAVVSTSEAARLNLFISAAIAYGATDLRINSNFRDSDKQGSMRNTWESEVALNGTSVHYPYGVAKPFSSCHELGVCLDLNFANLDLIQVLAVVRAASEWGMQNLQSDVIHFTAPAPNPGSRAWANKMMAAQEDWVRHGSSSANIPPCGGN